MPNPYEAPKSEPAQDTRASQSIRETLRVVRFVFGSLLIAVSMLITIGGLGAIGFGMKQSVPGWPIAIFVGCFQALLGLAGLVVGWRIVRRARKR